MIHSDSHLLLDIENAYESVKLNLEAISYIQLCLCGHHADENLLMHLNYLCELDAAKRLVEMKDAIDQLKPRLRDKP